jgi:class 3 adenylate cyclase
MDGAFEIMLGAVHRWEGTVNQFTGDGIMALFGAPIAHEDHARRACHAALEIQRGFAEHAARLRRDRGFGIQIRLRVDPLDGVSERRPRVRGIEDVAVGVGGDRKAAGNAYPAPRIR